MLVKIKPVRRRSLNCAVLDQKRHHLRFGRKLRPIFRFGRTEIYYDDEKMEILLKPSSSKNSDTFTINRDGVIAAANLFKILKNRNVGQQKYYEVRKINDFIIVDLKRPVKEKAYAD